MRLCWEEEGASNFPGRIASERVGVELVDLAVQLVYACGVTGHCRAYQDAKQGHGPIHREGQPKEEGYERLHDHRCRYPCNGDA